MTSVSQPGLATGFEHGLAVGGTNPDKVFLVLTGAATVVSGAAHYGNYGLRLAPSGAVANVYPPQMGTTGMYELFGGFYFNYQTFMSANTGLFYVRSQATIHAVGFEFNASTDKVRPHIRNESSNTDYTGDDCSIDLVENVWYRIDWAYTKQTTTLRRIDWWIAEGDADGTAQTTFEADTVAAGYTTSYCIGELNDRGNTATGEVWVDDVVALYYDDVSPGNYSYQPPLGNFRVARLVPDGDGTHNNAGDFTDDLGNSPPASVYDRLDETPLVNASSDYVRQSTGGAPSTSYLEVTLSDPPTDWQDANAPAIAAFLCYGTFAPSTGTTAEIDAYIYDTVNSTYIAAIGHNAVFANKRWGYDGLFPTGSAVDTDFLKDVFEGLLLRMGYASSTDMDPNVRIEDVSVEVAFKYAAAVVGVEGWGILLA